MQKVLLQSQLQAEDKHEPVGSEGEYRHPVWGKNAI